MNIKKITAITAAALIACTFTACGKKKSEKSTSSGTGLKKTETDIQIQENSGETAVAAGDGQVYLEIRDEDAHSQYLGSTEENLCYNAVVADITANGSYTVSVTANTDGYRTSAGGNADNYTIKPNGLMYAALRYKGGANIHPGAVLTIDSIKVDGVDVPMSAKNFTFTESGTDIKTYIYNEWTTKVVDGAVSAEGSVTDDTPGYASSVVDKANFESWTVVQVNFTVSGL